jgi:hypothetical protein
MSHEGDGGRDEVYERIPWETLQKGSGDRQWLVYAVAGAITLGALAYSFTRNRPPAPTAVLAPAESAITSPSTVPPGVATTRAHPPSTVASPVVVAEADLFAVEPERLLDQASAHAEWFAVEYIATDGTDESQATLRSLLPLGLPLPEAPDGTQVFVDWARSVRSTQTGPLSFEFEVLVRSLLSVADTGFTRQPATLLTVTVELADDGQPRVTGAPATRTLAEYTPMQAQLEEVPEEVTERLGLMGTIVGGRDLGDGTWEVVAMVAGPDGVQRPVTLSG